MPLGRIYSAVAGVLLSLSGRSFSWIVLSGGLLAACAGDLVLPATDGGGGPTAIRVADGDRQSGEVGEKLPAPVVVEVTDAEGLPVEGATVEFALISAGDGAEVIPSTTTTLANGRAEAHVFLGSKVGLQTGEARVVVGEAISSKASFSALAAPNDRDNESPDNESPDADYNWHCEDLACEFTDASTDDDGTVVSWHWQFGDGSTSPDVQPTHVYPAPGTYIVILTVTDNDGAADQSSAHVDVEGSGSQDDDD